MEAAYLVLVLPLLISGQELCRDSYGTPYRQGEEPIVGNSWLRCWNGQLSLGGCVDRNGQKVAIGQTTETKGYVMTCVQVSETMGYLSTTACVHDGRIVRPMESVRTQYFEYTCQKMDTGVSLDITACLDENGNTIRPGGSVIRGDFRYQCSNANGYVQLQPVGCIYDGAEYSAGATFDGDKFWYTCELSQGNINRRIEGCLDKSNRRISPGQTYQKNGFVLKCESAGSGIATRVIACTQELPNGRIVEHPVGSKWTEGVEPFQYTVHCTTCSDGSTVMRSLTKCKVRDDSVHTIVNTLVSADLLFVKMKKLTLGV